MLGMNWEDDIIPLAGSPEALAQLRQAEDEIKAGFYYTSKDMDKDDGKWLMECNQCKAIGDLMNYKQGFPHADGCPMKRLTKMSRPIVSDTQTDGQEG